MEGGRPADAAWRGGVQSTKSSGYTRLLQRITIIAHVNEDSETVRVEAFSDGVFAIAMTLLVTAIKVPHELVAVKGLRQSLLALWPSYVAFLTSFVTVLVAWVHHHWVFTLIRRIEHPFLYWNGLLLLCITSRFKRRCCPRIFSTQRRRSSRICIQGHSLQSRSPSMRCGGMPRNGCCPPVKPA